MSLKLTKGDTITPQGKPALFLLEGVCGNEDTEGDRIDEEGSDTLSRNQAIVSSLLLKSAISFQVPLQW